MEYMYGKEKICHRKMYCNLNSSDQYHGTEAVTVASNNLL